MLMLRLFSQVALRRCIGLALAVPILATAQTYPDRTIQIINPYPPGTASDVTSREFANQLSKVLKQSVVVVNRPGAGGLIATQFAAQQTPDGYTLFAAANGTHVINPIINSNAKYDPVRDFVPISRMVSFPNVLVDLRTCTGAGQLCVNRLREERCVDAPYRADVPSIG